MLSTPVPGPAFEPRLPLIVTADTLCSPEVPAHRLLSFEQMEGICNASNRSCPTDLWGQAQ